MAPRRSATPVETEVRSWDLATNAEGRAEIQIKASEKGQYRLSYHVTDKAEHEIEGGYLFTIIGEGFDGSEFRFNDLESCPTSANTRRTTKSSCKSTRIAPASTFCSSCGPPNGVYLPPQTIAARAARARMVELGVTQKDMPNFFVEAVTVSNGQVHTEVREIHVPPAKRIFNVEVVPSADAYQPGQHAKVKLKLTDEARQAVCRLHRALGLRQEPGVHFGRHERCGHQRILLEVAARTSAVSRDES